MSLRSKHLDRDTDEYRLALEFSDGLFMFFSLSQQFRLRVLQLTLQFLREREKTKLMKTETMILTQAQRWYVHGSFVL